MSTTPGASDAIARRIGGVHRQTGGLATIHHPLRCAGGWRTARQALLGAALSAHFHPRERLRRALTERHVPHDAVVVAVARDRQHSRLEADVAHRQAIGAAAVGEQDGVLALRIRALAACDLRFGGLRLDLRVRDWNTGRRLDDAGDDVR
ncbi:MAG: hypothetical protein U5K74_16085 [Gemmatimonadaceae bacterium]|nr:hypothetical protein [Gemmatimonadaceae bacterium]